MKRIAAITMARNDEFFLGRWIQYYGRELGTENLYIYLDGLDQKIPKNSGNANIKKFEHKNQSRSRGDKTRIKLLNDLSSKLFDAGYDIVIGVDTDEFLIVNPDIKKNLKQYLSDTKSVSSLSGLGLDVGMDLNLEYELDQTKPFLMQRNYALLSTRYTKPCVKIKNVLWGSGFHSIKKHNFHIDKNLYLLHFGSVDLEMIKSKMGARSADWAKHLKRRADTIYTITKKLAKKNSDKNTTDKNIKLARFLQTFLRPIYALNKPSMLGKKLVIKIPKSFIQTEI